MTCYSVFECDDIFTVVRIWNKYDGVMYYNHLNDDQICVAKRSDFYGLFNTADEAENAVYDIKELYEEVKRIHLAAQVKLMNSVTELNNANRNLENERKRAAKVLERKLNAISTRKEI